MSYIPNPIDTANINLNKELSELVDLLSKNTHEIWAKQRLMDGWVYGPERNDKLKTHPGLIPFEELPEPEKVYDQNTSIEVLKVILSLGYKIEKK